MGTKEKRKARPRIYAIAVIMRHRVPPLGIKRINSMWAGSQSCDHNSLVSTQWMLNRPALMNMYTLFSKHACSAITVSMVSSKLESASTVCDPSGWWLWSLLRDDDKQSTLCWELNIIWCIEMMVSMGVSSVLRLLPLTHYS